MNSRATSEDLVDAWLNVPEVAERLGLDVGKVRRLLQEGKLLAVRRGEPRVQSIPAAFLVPEHLANPSAPTHPAEAEDDRPRWAVLSALQGTLTVLSDAGFDDEAALVWLFTPDDSLPGTPIEALRAGAKTEVRRRAQAEL